MKSNIIRIGYFFIIVFVLLSCHKESKNIQPETEEILKTESLETVYGCTNVPGLLSTYPETFTDGQSFLLINTQTDFESKLSPTPDCSPKIDFDKYTLLIGTKMLNSGYSNIAYELKKITKDSKYSLALKVTFTLNAATVISNVTYHVLMPKQPENILINVSFETK
ncbi:MAG: hypothetical protein QM727_11255 [Niabella sp.]